MVSSEYEETLTTDHSPLTKSRSAQALVHFVHFNKIGYQVADKFSDQVIACAV